MKKLSHKALLDKAGRTMAHLYGWASIVDFLEGGSTPARHDNRASRVADRIIKMCQAEQRRCLMDFDKLEALAHPAAPAQVSEEMVSAQMVATVQRVFKEQAGWRPSAGTVRDALIAALSPSQDEGVRS